MNNFYLRQERLVLLVFFLSICLLFSLTACQLNQTSVSEGHAGLTEVNKEPEGEEEKPTRLATKALSNTAETTLAKADNTTQSPVEAASTAPKGGLPLAAVTGEAIDHSIYEEQEPIHYRALGAEVEEKFTALWNRLLAVESTLEFDAEGAMVLQDYLELDCEASLAKGTLIIDYDFKGDFPDNQGHTHAETVYLEQRLTDGSFPRAYLLKTDGSLGLALKELIATTNQGTLQSVTFKPSQDVQGSLVKLYKEDDTLLSQREDQLAETLFNNVFYSLYNLDAPLSAFNPDGVMKLSDSPECIPAYSFKMGDASIDYTPQFENFVGPDGNKLLNVFYLAVRVNEESEEQAFVIQNSSSYRDGIQQLMELLTAGP